jgi:hypothetical protein
MSYIAKDWLVAPAVLIFAIILFLVSTKKCLREPGKYWSIVITDMTAIALLTFLVVNLRWEKWMEFYLEDSSHFEIPLWAMNLIVLTIFGGLLGLFVVISRKQKRLMMKKNSMPG